VSSNHPSETDLALLAGGELNWLQRFRIEGHVSRCGDCRDVVASFGELRSAIHEYTPSETFDWDRISADMRANIRVGLDAGECVREIPASVVRRWKPQLAIGMAGVLLLAGAGVFLRSQLPHDTLPAAMHAAVLESTGSGVQVRSGSGSMTLTNDGDVTGDQTITSQGAIRTSYVDGTTGTVTVNSVYVE
jgi:hypothetical protein